MNFKTSLHSSYLSSSCPSQLYIYICMFLFLLLNFYASVFNAPAKYFSMSTTKEADGARKNAKEPHFYTFPHTGRIISNSFTSIHIIFVRIICINRTIKEFEAFFPNELGNFYWLGSEIGIKSRVFRLIPKEEKSIICEINFFLRFGRFSELQWMQFENA